MVDSNSKKPLIKFDQDGTTESTDQDRLNQANEPKPRLDSTIRKTTAGGGRESTLRKAALVNTDVVQASEEKSETHEEDEEDENEVESENDKSEEKREIAEAFSLEQFESGLPSEVGSIAEAEAAGLQQCQVIVDKAKERHDLVDEYLRLKAELKCEEKKNAYLQDRIYKTSVRKGIIDEAKQKRDEAKHRRKSANIRLILRRKMLALRAMKREQRRQMKRMEEFRARKSKRKKRESRFRMSKSHTHRHKSKLRQSFADSVKKDDEDHEGRHSHRHRESRAESHGHGDDTKHCKHKHSRESKHHRHSHTTAPRESSAGHERRKSHHHKHHHKDKQADGEDGKKEEEAKDSADVQMLSVSKNVPKSAKVKHLQRMHRSKSFGTSVLTEQECKNKEFDFGKANPTFALKGRGRLYDRINNEFKYDWLIRQVIIHLRKERKYAFYHENNLKRQACKRDLWKRAHEQKLQEILHLLRAYSEEAVDSNTGHRIPSASTEQFCKDIANIHAQLCDTMVSMFKSRRGLELSLRRLEASEVEGEGLQMLEYEQLRSENQTLKDRLGDRVKDVDNIKDKITHAIQVLAHFCNKMFSVNYMIAEGNEELDKVNTDLYGARGQSELMARRHELIKRKEQGLVVESGLLDNTTLLRDYERTHFHVQDLKNEKRTLTQELDRYTKEISEIKKRIIELQTNYPDIYAKQKALIEGKRTEKKRQRLLKFGKVRDQC